MSNAKMGRPPVDIDMDKLATLMRYKPTAKDCAAFFKCSVDTIENRIREYAGVTFSEFRDQNMVHTRFSLIQSAIRRGMAGDNTMHIFCLKNLCGWSDKGPDDKESTAIAANINISDEQLSKLVQVARGKKNDNA